MLVTPFRFIENHDHAVVGMQINSRIKCQIGLLKVGASPDMPIKTIRLHQEVGTTAG